LQREVRGGVSLREARERRAAMHPRVRHPVDKVVLQGRLVAAILGVADSHSEDEAVRMTGSSPKLASLRAGQWTQRCEMRGGLVTRRVPWISWSVLVKSLAVVV
jgi:hypothetical protein